MLTIFTTERSKWSKAYLGKDRVELLVPRSWGIEEFQRAVINGNWNAFRRANVELAISTKNHTVLNLLKNWV